MKARPFSFSIAAKAFCCSLLLTNSVMGDFLVYFLPNGRPLTPFEGKITAKNNKTIRFLGDGSKEELIFGKDTAAWIELESIKTSLQRQMELAQAEKKAPELVKLGLKALRSGYVKAFRNTIEAALEIDPNLAVAKGVKSQFDLFESSIPESQSEETELRKQCPALAHGKVYRSNHFILLTDIPEKIPEGQKKNKIEQRLELMERVYASFICLFAEKKIMLPIPKERLRICIFRQQADFQSLASEIGADPKYTAGFYILGRHQSYFFEAESSEQMADLHEVNEQLLDLKKQLKRAQGGPMKADINRYINMMTKFFIPMLMEGQNVEVLSHEIVHHVAAATGLMPRDREVPRWAAEGIACYFECPKNATWAGIGAVNTEQLRNLQHSNADDLSIDKVVSDRNFSAAKSIEERVACYGQAWSITHFLIEKYPERMFKYYQLFGAHPKRSLMIADPQKLEEARSELFMKAFDKIFSKNDRSRLNTELNAHMRSLKTDFQIATGSRGFLKPGAITPRIDGND